MKTEIMSLLAVDPQPKIILGSTSALITCKTPLNEKKNAQLPRQLPKSTKQFEGNVCLIFLKFLELHAAHYTFLRLVSF